MNYQVGQVLYTCNEKSLKIIPIQIVEIVVRTTIDGEKKEYIVRLPDKDTTHAPLNAIKGKIFNDVESIKKHLIENATSAIEKMIGLANDLVEEKFNIKKQANQTNNDVQVENKDDIIMVDLGGGVKAKMNTKSLEGIKAKWIYYF